MESTKDAPPAGAALAALRQAQLFRGLADEDVDALIPHFRTRRLSRGQPLYQQGDRGPAQLFVLLEGRLTVAQAQGDDQTVLVVLGPSDMAGEVGALDPGPRTSTITAVVPSIVAALPREELLRWASARSHVAERLLQVLARRLRRTNDTLGDMIFVDVPGRVAKALLDLGDRFGHPHPDGLRADHGLSQQDLALLVGSSRETVNKALADFANRGWIGLERRAVVIRQPDALRRRARVPA